MRYMDIDKYNIRYDDVNYLSGIYVNFFGILRVLDWN